MINNPNTDNNDIKNLNFIEEHEFDIKELYYILSYNIKLVFLIFIGVFFLSWVYIFTVIPQYELL